MPRIRLIALLLLLASIGFACLGLDFALTFALIPMRLEDGTIATPGMGIAGGLCLFIPGIILGIASGTLWFIVVPDQRAKAAHNARVASLQGHALSLYREWVALLQLQRMLQDPERNDIMRQSLRAITLSMLPDLDGAHKRALIQFLYDLGLIAGAAIVDLSEADLRGIDLRGAQMPTVDLHGTDLRGALLDGACLTDANLCDALVTVEQRARAGAMNGADPPIARGQEPRK